MQNRNREHEQHHRSETTLANFHNGGIPHRLTLSHFGAMALSSLMKMMAGAFFLASSKARESNCKS